MRLATSWGWILCTSGGDGDRIAVQSIAESVMGARA
jgi:hypothetical protein